MSLEFGVHILTGGRVATVGPVRRIGVSRLAIEGCRSFAFIAHGPVAPRNFIGIQECKPSIGTGGVDGTIAISIGGSPFGNEYGEPCLDRIADTVAEGNVTTVVAIIKRVGTRIEMEGIANIVAGIGHFVTDGFFWVSGIFTVADEDQIRTVVANDRDNGVGIIFDSTPHTCGGRLVKNFKNNIGVATPFICHISEKRGRFADFVICRVRVIVNNDVNVIINGSLDDRIVISLPVAVLVGSCAVGHADHFYFPVTD